MSLLDLSRPKMGSNIVPEDEEFKRPSTGEDLRVQARQIGDYQSSRARSKLAENAVNNMMEGMSSEDRKILESRVSAWREEKRVAALRPGVEPDAMIAEEIDYNELYQTLAGEEDSPITADDLHVAMQEELQRAHTAEEEGKENTLSDWAWLQGMAGGMQAGISDPVEQKSMLGSLAYGYVARAKHLADKAALFTGELLGVSTATAGYQPKVIQLYKDMGLEQYYGPAEAAMNVAAGALVDVGIAGAGKTLDLTFDVAKDSLDKINQAQAQAIREGAGLDEIEKATPPAIAKAKKELEKEVITDPGPAADVPERKMAATRLGNVADDMAKGKAKDPEIHGARASTGPRAPSTEVAHTSNGSVNPGVAVAAAKAQTGKKFPVTAFRRDFVASQKDMWMRELTDDIKMLGDGIDEKKLATAPERKSALEANIEESKERVAYDKEDAKQYEGTDLQAEARKQVKDSNFTLTGQRQELKKVNAILKQRADLDKLIDELANLEQTGTLIKGSRYAKQVTAAENTAREVHTARAAKGETSEAIDDVEAQRDEALMDMGVLEDTRPSRAPKEGGVDLDADEAYEHTDGYYEDLDSIRQQQDSDMPSDWTVDEDYNFIEGDARDLVDDAEALDMAADMVRGCM